MSESEWQTCESPYEMLRHLDGKIADEMFMRFSVACCRRIWPLITDSRSRAVVEATEAYLAGTTTAEQAGLVCAEWVPAREAGEVNDLANGHTDEAIESVYGVGFGHAAQVSIACSESAAEAASELLRAAGASQPEIIATWRAAQSAERLAQCQLLRQLFGYQRESGTNEDEPAASADVGANTAFQGQRLPRPQRR